MNARTPYWPLFRNEFGIDHYPEIPWVLGLGFFLTLWLACSFVPLLLLFKTSRGDLGNFFAAFGELTGFAMIWWFAITGWLFAFALLPGISNPVQRVRAFEFMFTRAIDRRRLFRTRAAVIYLVTLGPLLLNVVVSANLPRSAGDPLPLSAPRPNARHSAGDHPRREQDLTKSAARNIIVEKLPLPSTLMLISTEVIFTSWIFWLGTLGLLLMQSYCVLLARRVQHNPWLAGMAIGAPVIAACFLAPWIPRHYPSFYEENFLFFARHIVPLSLGLLVLMPVVQVFSERKFRKLEIL